MDSLFLLGVGERANYLQQMVRAFNCTYICLWSYLPEPNCVLCLDGLYREPANQITVRRLFDEYRQAPLAVDNGVPGLAFKNHYPYMKLEMADLIRLASTETQLQFYHEAGIKNVVFMGCNAGEIEFGISDDAPVNLEMELKTWFPEDFSRQSSAAGDVPVPHDQARPSSSSSSLRSLSVDSSEYSPLLFNIPSSAYIPEPAKEALVEQTMGSASPTVPSTAETSPHHHTIHGLTQIRSIQFPSIESEDAALTKAMLAVISSPSSSSSPHRPPAFHNYRLVAGLAHRTPPASAGNRRPSMFKRALAFYTNLSLQLQRQGGQVQGSRPTSTQLHHMIAERRRREKLNESFQVLRSLLPLGTKKDKASVLANTTEYLSSLKAQVAELNKRNRILEAQLLPPPQEEENVSTDEQTSSPGSSSTTQSRVQVRIMQVGASTSEARMVDLQVDVRRECNMLDLVIGILEFLKHVNNISVVSIDANTRVVAPSSSLVNRVMLRLRIEGGEWDESAFHEAVRRVVG